MKLHPKSLAISAVILSAALAACQEPYHQKEEQYYLISANIGLPYWQEAEAGLRDAATGMGVKAEMDGPATLSPQEELDSFQQSRGSASRRHSDFRDEPAASQARDR